jgi:hypothetical protein
VFRKRRPVSVSPQLTEASVAFRRTVDAVEGAKRRLSAAAPGGRSAGVPLAEALAGFEEGLGEARAIMPGWRVPEMQDEWSGCSAAVDEVLDRAKRLRLGAVPEGYEQLYGILGDLMDPLDAFARPFRRFRALGL